MTHTTKRTYFIRRCIVGLALTAMVLGLFSFWAARDHRTQREVRSWMTPKMSPEVLQNDHSFRVYQEQQASVCHEEDPCWDAAAMGNGRGSVTP